MKARYLFASLGLALAVALSNGCGSTSAPAHTPTSVPPSQQAQTQFSRKLSLEEILRFADIRPDYTQEILNAAFGSAVMDYEERRLVSQLRGEYDPVHGMPSSIELVRQNPVEYMFFIKDADRYKELISKAEAALSHGLGYWSGDMLPRPDARIIIPFKAEDLSSDDGFMPVYAVLESGNIFAYIVNKAYPDGYAKQEIAVVKHASGGHSGSALNRQESNGKIAYVPEEGSGIFWSVDADDPYSFRIPALEVLHRQMVALTAKELSRKIGDKLNITDAELGQLVNDLILQEEIMVHGGIGLNWTEQLSRDWDLGLTESQISSIDGTSRLYPRPMEQMKERVGLMGVREAINLYATNMPKLFANLGNYSK